MQLQEKLTSIKNENVVTELNELIKMELFMKKIFAIDSH